MDDQIDGEEFFVQIRPRAETEDKFIKRTIIKPNLSDKNLILKPYDEISIHSKKFDNLI